MLFSSRIKINAWDYTNGMQDPKLTVPGGKSTARLDAGRLHHHAGADRDPEARRGGAHKGLLTDEWLEYRRDATEWQIEPALRVPGVASGIYDYIQWSIWTTNDAFANFLYFSPSRRPWPRWGKRVDQLSTDLLMVNPNNGFKWHQDNQNGPVCFEDALRWW